MNAPHPLIAVAMAKPMTHRVTTVYADGRERHHDTRSLGAAENFAVGERRKIGRKLLDRETGATVQVAYVEVAAL